MKMSSIGRMDRPILFIYANRFKVLKPVFKREKRRPVFFFNLMHFT